MLDLFSLGDRFKAACEFILLLPVLPIMFVIGNKEDVPTLKG
jgi:hypothetical protein